MTANPRPSRFSVSEDMVEAFRQASADANPLHVDEAYARCTPFGQPIAHGVLGALITLGATRDRAGHTLARIRARFAQPLFCGQDYTRAVDDDSPDRAVVKILDGSRLAIEVVAEFRSIDQPARWPPVGPGADSGPPVAVRAEARDLALDEIMAGQPVEAGYSPRWDRLAALLDLVGARGKGLDVGHAAVLAWVSYLVGMEMPGRAALLSSVEVAFDERDERAGSAPEAGEFRAGAEVGEVDTRFRLVRLAAHADTAIRHARVEAAAFVRAPADLPSAQHVGKLLPPTMELAHRVAFVVGGSRGLGAAVVQTLAQQGCTVYAGFHRSRHDGEAVRSGLGPSAERVHLLQGDAGDVEWCERARDHIVATHGRLDVLVLNACPPLHGLSLDAATADRAADYVRRALALAQGPLACCVQDVAEAHGCVVAISSGAVAAPPTGWFHYVSAKWALEGLIRAAAAERPRARFLLVRPPRLRTTFADTPLVGAESLPVEPVATAVVRRLLDSIPDHAPSGLDPGEVEILDEFPKYDDEDVSGTVVAAPEEAPEEAAKAENPGTLAIAATFTVDPLRDVLAYWVERLNLGLDVVLTPYAQVFQELLDPTSVMSRNDRGCNVVLLRLEDWPGGEEGNRVVEEFVAAAENHAGRSRIPLLIRVCPPSPRISAHRGSALEIAEMEEQLEDALGAVRGVHVVGSKQWSDAYHIADYHDPAREELASIPYTPAACTAMGTAVMRTVHALLATPFKVLVLDCDNTLWKGVCGEDGPDGIVVGSAHRYLQQWAVDLQAQGVLVCLCSKNNETDVDEVFRHRTDLPLRPEHLAARRINWDPKPDNLRALADELGLGLKSFVFLDDNPVEVAAVQSSCPDVLALATPDDPVDVPGFLDRIWAFDRPAVTDEDRRRTAFYSARREREALRRSSVTFAEFIQGLALKVDVRQAGPGQLTRVSQLTHRVNQFTTATTRRSEPEIGALLADEGRRCWVAEVRDRFGDYGLVGAAFTRRNDELVELDTFLLSCRVLGRGVEHAFLAHIGREAAAEGASTFEITFVPTTKNTPARRFLDAVAGKWATPQDGGKVVYRLPVDRVAGICFRPDEVDGTMPVSGPASSTAGDVTSRDRTDTTVGTDRVRLAALAGIAGDLDDVAKVYDAVRKRAGQARQEQVGEKQPVGTEQAAPVERTIAGQPPCPKSTAGDSAQDGGGEAALRAVCDVFAQVLAVPREELGAELAFEELRPSSLDIINATVALEKRFGDLPKTVVFEHRTLGGLARFLAERFPDGPGQLADPDRSTVPESLAPAHSMASARTPVHMSPAPTPAHDLDGVAVVGLAGRYPGAANIEELWRSLLAGRSSISALSPDRWDHRHYFDPAGGSDKSYSRWGGRIDGVGEFDALFFGIAPSEAALMDPQQRLFLQTAYEAMQDAGHTPASLGRDVGVYVGAATNDYGVLSAAAALRGQSPYPYAEVYQIANRVSHFFDFIGPSLVVDTACSASGLAVHLACEALRHRAVSAAIAGGVNLVLHPSRYIWYSQMGMLSRDERCRAFGEGADGFVLGEGVGAVILKPLAQAIADGDHIYGVIRGTWANSDGRTNGFTVPNPMAQAALIKRALERAGVDPDTISYVETHGSGTALGDSIEIRGLTAAFADRSTMRDRCAIGSVKTNVGHLAPAAAIAGLTKVLLQLRHRTLVPSLNAERPNPLIDFDQTPFYLQREVAEWRRPRLEVNGDMTEVPRRAGLSSFGAGGANVHLVIEEWPPADAVEPRDREDDVHGPDLVVLSARGVERLRAYAGRLRDALARQDGLRLPDVTHTLRVGREVFDTRVAFVARTTEETVDVLGRIAAGEAEVAAGIAFGRVDGVSPLAGIFDGSTDLETVLSGLVRRGELDRLGRLWVQGVACGWERLFPARRRVSLPTYPFSPDRHWLAAEPRAVNPAETPGPRVAPVACYRPQWQPAPELSPSPSWAPPPPGTVVRVLDEHARLRLEEEDDCRRLLTDAGPGAELLVVDYRPLGAVPVLDQDAMPQGLPPRLVVPFHLARAAADAGTPRVTYVCLSKPEEDDPYSGAVTAFGRSVAQEGVPFRCVRIEVADDTRPDLADVFAEVGRGEAEIRIQGRERWVRRFTPVTSPGGPANGARLRDRGVYLVTGGTGGVGRLITRHLATRYRASLMLVGRRPTDQDIDRLLDELRASGGQAVYRRANVTDSHALIQVIDETQARFGGLNGVIHAAGVIEDVPLRDKSVGSFACVLAPKTVGTVVLDQVTAAVDLDFFLLMSSIVGTLGNTAQGDYAAASRFLDGFAVTRTAAVRAGRRSGRTVSVAWPLWAEGGMRQPAEVTDFMRTALGLDPIDTATALRVLEAALATDEPAVFVAHGDHERIETALAGAAAPADATPAVPAAVSGTASEDLVAMLRGRLRQEAAKVLELTAEDIDPNAEFGTYGMHSVLVVAFINRLNVTLGLSLTPVVLFENPTLAALTEALLDRYVESIRVRLMDDKSTAAQPESGIVPGAAGQPGRRPDPCSDQIAIVGLAGRFPASPGLDAFWANLVRGRCVVREVPENRWNWREFYGDPSRELNVTNCPYGGFLDDVDAFDAAFFNISPREAHLMDPQQRLFLETCWTAIEHAGYDPQRLLGSRTGVFAGVSLHDYYELLTRGEPEIASHTVTGNVHSIVPNRVSYLLDLHGPSEAIDTACSSSLVALHRAITALQGGECDLAIAGGVNVLLSPTLFVSLSKAGMLSPTGRCKVFDRQADGFVRGEGVGAVVLKPLRRALDDGDTVHAVILGSAVNHGGRGHSLTAPNPTAQADVVTQALTRAGVAVNTLSYLETHGTGTELGDPVEIAGLQEAFARLQAAAPGNGPLRPASCALGAVKANIGHLEPAAGIAGLIAVVLAMRHRTLPPNALIEDLSPYIDLSETAFYVPDSARVWEQSVDLEGNPVPRRAGVSSFGFGGSNAHVVMEEPPQPVARLDGQSLADHSPQVVTLSATNPERLRAYAASLREFLAGADGETSLFDLAFTAQVGRPALRSRLALVASAHDELRERIDAFLACRPAPGIHSGEVVMAPDGERPEVALGPVAPHELAERWIRGEEIDRVAQHGSRLGRRVPFPTYPFDRASRHGLTGPATLTRHQPEPTPIASAERPTLLARRWERIEPAPEGAEGQRALLLLVGREATIPLLGSLDSLPTVEWVVIRERSTLPQLTREEHELDLDDYAAGRRLADEIIARHPHLDGLIDLVDLDPTPGAAPGREAARIAILQALAARAGREFRVVHVTRRLVAFDNPEPTLAGARIASLVRTLGFEYSTVHSTTVDVDHPLAQVSDVLATAVRELGSAGTEPDICYRHGERYATRFEEIDQGDGRTAGRVGRPASFGPFEIDPHRTYLVTGGTGGLGLAVAERLVERGARRLALLGRRPVPPRDEWEQRVAAGDAVAEQQKIESLLRIEKSGAQVALYHGCLTDRDAMVRFLDDIRRRLGVVAGVIHCAGAVSQRTPAFVHKPFAEIADIWRPKCEGLLTLDELLAGVEPDFFVLYSSVSAVLPTLAVGLADYASANAFLDAFAAAAQARRTRTRYLSIDWGNWDGPATGTGLGMGEARSPRYQDLGFSALSRNDGLDLLATALAVAPGPSVVAATVRPDTLERLRRVKGTAGAGPTLSAPEPEPLRPGATDDRLAVTVEFVTEVLGRELMISPDQIEPDSPFADLGVDSILIAGMVVKLEPLAGTPLDPSVILEYPSVAALSRHLVEQCGQGIEAWRQRSPALRPASVPGPAPALGRYRPLAVVGMASRFPCAPSTEEFWTLLATGRSGIREVPRSRWSIAELYSPRPEPGKSISKWGGFLDGIEEFDPDFFGIAAEDAAHLDPLIRLFLECAEQTFRDAGYERAEIGGRRIGVFAGSGTSTYGSRILVPRRATATGLNQNFIAAQLAHVYDLRGPNMVVDSACSSSLAGLYLAHQALALGDCEMALVGGADLLLDEAPYLQLSAAQALSPEGTCHVFDVRANGFVPGEGVGAVLLKPLDAALADRDSVYAVVEACAMNNDGHTMGLTTPNPQAQEQVILDALEKAGANPATISYVEAHGTGTMIGDPMELKALTTVFRRFTDERGFCAVGSVKSNIGHLLMAAGIAGLQKVVLSLVHGVLPPTLHCQEPNPRFSFETSPFHPNVTAREWQPRDGLRRAGISAFGFGGTNCHAILRELTAKERAAFAPRRKPLHPAVFNRRRFWVDRPVPTPNTSTDSLPPTVDDAESVPGLRPLLELEEVT